MLPCFLHALSTLLVERTSKSSHIRCLVSFGSSISSTKPLCAATNGLTNLSVYSRVFFSTIIRISIDNYVRILLLELPSLPLKIISTAPLAPITAISAVGQA